MGGESSTRPGSDVIAAGNFHELLRETDWDSEVSPELHIKEELVEEVMQELYREITCPSPPPQLTTCSSSSTLNVASSPSPSSEGVPSPASSSLPAFRAVFADDGKSESCGASVSDSSSTVMAGVEYVGVAGKAAGGSSLSVVSGGSGEWMEGMMDGCDQVEFDDEWLERVMSWVPLELEGWT
ncbi:hypothetical protein Tsubulata_037841 [Turnera subulata]|uniref:Uncharacterized protein n=1 Tax=Turnera subulata TaxID=218843 RepID=A0A9Q0JES1_9ROSI|nr:hypothetical protein Tsubulata_037841 [Turnera subulata]